MIGRRRFKPGDTVFVNVAADHRDPELFDDPDYFDITRETDTGDILSFGIGSHFCLGQQFVALTERLSNLAVARYGLTREQNLLLRGPQRLELTAV